MYGSFFPPIERIEFYDNGVKKDARKLPDPVKERLREFVDDLKNGHVSSVGKNISHISGIKKYRLNDQFRVAFTIRKDTASILCIGNHDEMDEFLKAARRL